MDREFEHNEIAILKKSRRIVVRIGSKFDSKVLNISRNPSGISYYIEGYSIRNWCYEEELRKITIFDKLFKFLAINKL
jgi:hypothetical protein